MLDAGSGMEILKALAEASPTLLALTLALSLRERE